MEFVRPIGTIDVTVATPVCLDAEFWIGALEFAFAACRVALGLIASIVTVEFTVAMQCATNTTAVATPEFRLAAVAWGATLFVRSIATVVIVIATPSTGNTLVVFALGKKKQR